MRCCVGLVLFFFFFDLTTTVVDVLSFFLNSARNCVSYVYWGGGKVRKKRRGTHSIKHLDLIYFFFWFYISRVCVYQVHQFYWLLSLVGALVIVCHSFIHSFVDNIYWKRLAASLTDGQPFFSLETCCCSCIIVKM